MPRPSAEQPPEPSQPLRAHPAAWLVGLAIAGILAAAVFFRVWQLGHVPGINGDEAWYGLEAERLLRGEPIAWRTPSGNLLNPFYFLPLVALHALFPPSFVLLRAVALASGVLALAANFVFARRLFGRSTALVSTVLLAVLPINIAYSRFGWDASQSLLATLVVMYLALEGLRAQKHRAAWLVAAAVAFAAALVIHPTNVFAAPLVAIPLGWHERHRLIAACDPRRWSLGGGAIALAALVALASTAWLSRRCVGISEHLATPAELAEFALLYGRLFSGTTIYQYLSGSVPTDSSALAAWPPGTSFWLDAGVWLVVLLTAGGLSRRFRRGEPGQLDAALLAGWAIMLFGFFLVAGPQAVRPHFERYAICLVAPAVLLVSRGIAGWLGQTGMAGRAALVGGLAGAVVLLASFHAHYFRFIEQTGGQGHACFRTGPREPKQLALEQILSEHEAGQPTWIVASTWWNYQPLAYLAARDARLRVATWPAVAANQEFQQALAAARVSWVEFSGSQEHRACVRTLSAGGATSETTVRDWAGRPLLAVVHRAPPDQAPSGRAGPPLVELPAETHNGDKRSPRLSPPLQGAWLAPSPSP